MPNYTFEDKKSGEQFELSLTMSERESFLNDNPNFKQIITRMNIVSGVQGMTHKNDAGWNEVMSRLGDANSSTALGDRYGSKSIKDVKTRQAVEKWRKKRSADPNK